MICFELCEKNLRSFRAENDSLQTNLKILLQVIDGLQFIARKNHIHGDIKHANILIKHESEEIIAKISDFGLGKY